MLVRAPDFSCSITNGHAASAPDASSSNGDPSAHGGSVHQSHLKLKSSKAPAARGASARKFGKPKQLPSDADGVGPNLPEINNTDSATTSLVVGGKEVKVFKPNAGALKLAQSSTLANIEANNMMFRVSQRIFAKWESARMSQVLL